MALPTNGRVIIETSVGELDIELWSKVGQVSQILELELNATNAGST
jgi:hypothetical protein